MGRILFFQLILCSVLICSCSSNNNIQSTNNSIFCTGEVIATVTDAKLNEISGIAASTTNSGCYWVHNDSGDMARIFLINSDGQLVATINFTGIVARDWEDIATAADPNNGTTYIYISETGDNQAQYPLKYIYKLAEPQIDTHTLNQVITIDSLEKITFQYEDGNRDAETLFVENATGDIYVVSKREKHIGVYILPYPQATQGTLSAHKVQTLPFTQATSGDISDDGCEILIKNYDSIFYWKRDPGETIGQTLAKKPTSIKYEWEPQGESIAWLNNGSAFVTISEMGREGITPKLFIYHKK